jgi:predicted RNase H-like nuclease (RuvC/YqgF family)
MEYSTAECVERFVEIRDEITNLTDKYKADKAALEELQTLLSDELFARLKAAGGTSIKTVAGSVIAKTTMSYKAVDFGDILRFIRETGQPELLQARLSSSAVKEWSENNDGALPPGVGTETTHSITIRRA